MSLIIDYIDSLISLIYPRLCMACVHEQAVKGDAFCIHCMNELPVSLHFDQKENDFNYHFYGRVPIVFGAALLNFYKDDMVKSMLHRLKYKRKKNIGNVLGSRLGLELMASPHFIRPDIIIPIPIHKKRALQRGYNQSLLIAEGVNKHLDCIIRDDILIKAKHTKSMTKQSRADRITSLYNSLELRKESNIYGKHILLIDDVLTTGATLEVCAIKLLEVKGVKISMATLAITKS